MSQSVASYATEVTLETVQRAHHRIGDQLAPTPTVHARALSEDLGYDLFFKSELFQHTGSFKSRGALNWVRTASPEELERGLITVSAGNHAQALAWAARDAGTPVTVVMPEGSSPAKIAATRRYGGHVVLHGAINQALEKMEELREREGLLLVHPYNNPRIIAGQGTVGLELAEQLPGAALVACPIGGGGLISGIGVALKTLRPDIRLIGVEPEQAATMRSAWDREDVHARLESVNTIATSLGASVVGEYTYAMSRRYVDNIVTVNEAEIVAGVRAVITQGKLYAEPGACVAVAALLAGRIEAHPEDRVVAVITGGNMDVEQAKGLL